MLSFISNFLFFAIPILTLIFFIFSICNYCSAKVKSKKQPDSVPQHVLKSRKIMLIVSSILFGILILCVIGIIVLLYNAIVYM